MAASTASSGESTGVSSSSDGVPRKKGLQGIGGDFVNMREEPAWEAVEGEDDRDPYSVPRERVKDRFYALAYNFAEQGTLTHQGVPKGNMEAARDWADKVWRGNCDRFDRLTKAFMEPGLTGKPKVVAMVHEPESYLAQLGVPQGDEGTAAAFYDFIVHRNRGRFEKMRSENVVSGNT